MTQCLTANMQQVQGLHIGPGFTHSHLSLASVLLSTIFGISLIYKGKNDNTN